jgi:hypothetical protein
LYVSHLLPAKHKTRTTATLEDFAEQATLFT